MHIADRFIDKDGQSQALSGVFVSAGAHHFGFSIKPVELLMFRRDPHLDPVAHAEVASTQMPVLDES